MRKTLPSLGFVFLLLALWSRADEPPATGDAGNAPGPSEAVESTEARGTRVVVIPVREQIAKPVLYVLRRGLKEAIEQKADAVVLDMKTPGGDAATMLEIMEALDKFPGATLTFVNDEAGSAGALIAAVTDEIYFAPTGVMGAAELIMGTGADVPEALKRKMTSFLAAKVRAFSDSDPRRADVLKAMMSADFELKIGEKVLKEKGELLTLTAKEATTVYGEPPQPLLAAGIAKDLDELLTTKFGAGRYETRQLEVTWSEHLAQFLNALSPILLGLGMLALFIEFKTPGFGIFGVTGILLLLVVFFGHYVAGFSGHEPVLVFTAGVVLVVLELFFFPGMVVMAVSGLALMLGALIWSMADLWPNEPLRVSGDAFAAPIANLALGILIAMALILLVVRFLPRGWFWDRMILTAAVHERAQSGGAAPAAAAANGSLIGLRGVAVTALFPSGQVEIAGRRFEAKLAVGFADPGTPVVVTGQNEFSLIVEVVA
ncbi:MAG TPA: NfeD family protein [Opitutaceae bacterium]